VEHDGEVHKIRLQWIATAKPSGNSESLPFCSIVDLDKEDADLFGRAAREFTAGYLDGRSFRMLIYSTPDKDGTLPALLFLPGGLLFQQILVEQGLACLVPRSSTQGMNPGGGTIETTLYRNLEAAQAEVMARQPRPGAWAMSRQSKP
jgi:endonuclease YncB( thermonuclease family)